MASGFCDWKLSLNSDFMGPSLQIPLTQLSHHLHENFICRSSQTLRFLFYSSDTSAHWSLLQISRLNGSYPRYLEGQTSLSDQLIPHNVKCTVYSNLSVILSMLFFSFLSPPTLSVFSPTSPSDQPIPQWIKPSDYSASFVTLSVFGLGLKTQSSSLHSLSCLPQCSHHPSYVQIPQITPSPSVTSSIFSLKQPITTPPPPPSHSPVAPPWAIISSLTC